MSLTAKLKVMSDHDADEQLLESSEYPLPPASFDFFVVSLKMQAELHMGLVKVPGAEDTPPDLRLARHSIDLLGMLQEKTKGNLTMEEQRTLDNSLTELRFRYLQAAQESAKA